MKKDAGPPPRELMENLGESKATLERPSDDNSEHVELKDHRPVASYNLIEGTATPSLLVPGSPYVWKSPEFPLAIEKAEKGAVAKKSYTDPNAAHNPASPMAALVQAIKVLEPNFEFSKTNLIVDRINLRRLLAWASSAPDSKDFRIDADLVGNTVMLTRWEAVLEGGKGNTDASFRKEALGDATSWDAVEEGEVGTHFRIVSLDFLGTKALVRFPVDCCTSDSRSRSLSTSTAGTLSPQADTKELPAMQDIASGLTVHTAGNLVPQSAIVELSLISKTAKFDRTAAYDTMLFSQTPSMYLARHSKGAFGSYEDIKLKEMRIEDKKAQPSLHKLHQVLKEIEAQMKKLGPNAKASLVNKGGKLELYERTGGVGLPQGLVDCFA